MTYKYGKPDRNHQEIIKFIRSIGGVVLDCKSLKNAFDILVGYKGKLYIIEIKDGQKPPSQRKLTKGEIQCREMFESVGCDYYVVTSTEDINKLLEL